MKMKPTECDHPNGFKHDNSYAGRYRVYMVDGHKHEVWREKCETCGAWIEVERIDGEVQ